MACTEEDAEPYKKYKVLYGERKFARNFVGYNQTSLANIDFLEARSADLLCDQTKNNQNPCFFIERLPVELRLHIYGHVFNIPHDDSKDSRAVSHIPNGVFELWAPWHWSTRFQWRVEGMDGNDWNT
jgi:hypothetical protein